MHLYSCILWSFMCIWHKKTAAVTLRYVGRKHQPELLKRSVAQDCLPFMSRDHFNISFSRGLFHIRTMTSNPIWRFRSGNEPIELQRGDPVDLQTGRGGRDFFIMSLYTWIVYSLHNSISFVLLTGKKLIDESVCAQLRLELEAFGDSMFASLVSGDRIALGTGNVGASGGPHYCRPGNPWLETPSLK